MPDSRPTSSPVSQVSSAISTESGHVVCELHLGFVEGALLRLGATVSVTDLIPFADPGRCRLVMTTRRHGRAGTTS